MAAVPSEVFHLQLHGASELMDLLHIDLEAEVMEDKPGRGDALCSRNVLRKQRNWERQLAVKRRRRGEEKQRKKFNREQEAGFNVLLTFCDLGSWTEELLLKDLLIEPA